MPITLQEIEESSLSELAKAKQEGGLTTPELENLDYEITFREDTLEWAARGGSRPTHQPPNP
jgi:hypothetical protein